MRHLAQPSRRGCVRRSQISWEWHRAWKASRRPVVALDTESCSPPRDAGSAVNEAAGIQLHRIIATYGPGICDDPRRVEALLRDLSGEHRRETFVLAAAAREGIPAELLASTGTVP